MPDQLELGSLAPHCIGPMNCILVNSRFLDVRPLNQPCYPWLIITTARGHDKVDKAQFKR